MTDQEKQELKEKLAKWAGWHEEKYEIARGAFAPILLAPNEKPIEGHVGYIPEHTPNFPDSFDDCSEWLVPNIPMLYEVVFRKTKDGFQCLIHRKPSYGDDLLIGEGKIEPLAFCLAVEKLIDGGTKNANQ